MSRYVLDSFALIAYNEGERSAETVREILHKAIDGKADLFMSVINWGEVYYITMRDGGEMVAEETLRTLREYPITLVAATEDSALRAATYKATNKMSYADAFAAALAYDLKAELVTGDSEFKPLEGIIKIKWLKNNKKSPL